MSIFGKVLGRFRSSRVLGMDIGSDGVRLALLRRDGDKFHLEWAEEVSLTDMQGFTDYEAVAEKIQPVLSARGIKNVDVAADPPWNSARVVLEEMPAMTNDRFYKAADWYFQQLDAEALLDPLHHAVPQTPRETMEGNRVIDGLMVSMDAVMVRGLDEMCQSLGLRLNWIAAQPLCYAQILQGAGLDQRNVFILDAGASQSRLYLAIAGHLLLVRKLKPCSNDIVKGLVETHDLTWQAAHQALQAHSGVDVEFEFTDEIRTFLDESIAQLAKQLGDEIQRSGAYTISRHASEVDTILVGGGITSSPLFYEQLTSRFDQDVQRIDPFASLLGDVMIPEGDRDRYALAIGAARQRLSAPPEHNILMAGKIQLADNEKVDGRFAHLRKYAAIGAAAAAVLAVGALEFSHFRRTRAQQERIEKFEAAVEEALQYAEAYGYNEDMFDLDDQIEALRGVYLARTLHTPFITQIVGCLPHGAWLTQLTIEEAEFEVVEEELSDAEEMAEDFEYESEDDELDDLLDEAYGEEEEAEAPTGYQVVLTGRTQDTHTVGNFILALETEGLVSKVQLLSVQEERLDEDEAGNGRPFYRFHLTGRPNLDLRGMEVAR